MELCKQLGSLCMHPFRARFRRVHLHTCPSFCLADTRLPERFTSGDILSYGSRYQVVPCCFHCALCLIDPFRVDASALDKHRPCFPSPIRCCAAAPHSGPFYEQKHRKARVDAHICLQPSLTPQVCPPSLQPGTMLLLSFKPFAHSLSH